jgi:hypothetical protein
MSPFIATKNVKSDKHSQMVKELPPLKENVKASSSKVQNRFIKKHNEQK